LTRQSPRGKILMFGPEGTMTDVQTQQETVEKQYDQIIDLIHALASEGRMEEATSVYEEYREFFL
jgi:pentatricopeptide repeat protein